MSNQKIADSRVLRNSLTSLSPFPFKACSERIIDFHFLSAHRAKFSCKKFWPPFYFAGFDASRWGVGTGKTANSQRARSIQPKFQPVRLGKLVHLKTWTRFFETFSNRSIEFWTKISENFGGMDRARSCPGSCASSNWPRTYKSSQIRKAQATEPRLLRRTKHITTRGPLGDILPLLLFSFSCMTRP